MAAISDDTAALVAAQLTAAWAAKSGVSSDPSRIQIEREIAEVYLRFRDALRETNLPKPDSSKVP